MTDAFKSTMDKMIKELTTQYEMEIAALKKRVRDLEDKKYTNKIIKLSLRGSVFEVGLATLCSAKSIYFYNRFAKDHHDDYLFIDRNPTVFNYVIDFLQGHPVPVDTMIAEHKFLWDEDVKFYDLVIPGKEMEITSYLKRLHVVDNLCPDIVKVEISSHPTHTMDTSLIFDDGNGHAFENIYYKEPNPWISFGFAEYKFRPTRYAIRQDHDHYLRNWQLQGKCGENWDVIYDHRGDESIKNKEEVNWAINGHQSYSEYRIYVTGPSHMASPNFDICQVKFWGIME